MIDWTLYPNFSENEMRCSCGCGRADMSPDFMAKLQTVRSFIKVPLIVTSGFRCPEYDEEIGGVGVHPTGHAADIAIYGRRAYDLLRLSVNVFWGIGIKQRGSGRFIHLDDLVSDAHPRPALWTY